MSLSKYMKSNSKSLIVLLAPCIAFNVMAAADKQTVQKGVTVNNELSVVTAQATVPAMPPMAFPMPSKQNHPANTMTTTGSREAKTMMMQSMMAASPLSVRELVAMMVTKHKVKPGVKFDEVIESLKLVANKNNFKYTGVSLLSQDVTATTGKPSPRVEILSFCDSVVARSVIDYAPELIAFLPCRVSVLEDANKDIWIVSLDWDISWMNLSKNPNNMDEKLWKESIRIRKVMDEMMETAANGDF